MVMPSNDPVCIGNRPGSLQDSSTPSKKRRLESGGSDFAVGQWVTVEPEIHEKADQLKGETPCLIIGLCGDSAEVLDPNQLSLFTHQYDGSKLIEGTQMVPRVRMRVCCSDDFPMLDLKMAQLLDATLEGKQTKKRRRTRSNRSCPLPSTRKSSTRSQHT